MAGDGLVRPLNAPPAAALAPGVQPGVSGGIITARYVIVFGTNDGVFVYSGKPGPGNKPVAWVSNASVDPYGNTLASTGGLGSFDGTAAWSQLVNGLLLLGSSAVNLPFRAQLNATTGAVEFLSPRLNAGDTRVQLDLIPSATPGSQTAAVDRIAAWAPGAVGTVETWHSVTVPTGMTGSIRVKILAEANFAMLDVNVTITSTTTANTTYTGGALPSAAYYPTQMSSAGNRQYPLSLNQTSAAPASNARLIIPAASGSIAVITPAFSTAGLACVVMGTITYPLD